MKLLNIGKDLKVLLGSELNKTTYNLINDEKAKPSFLVVKVDKIVPIYDKNNIIYADFSANILIVSLKYEEMIALSENIINTLNCNAYEMDDYIVEDIRIDNFNEDFEDELYIGEITISGTLTIK